MSEEKVLLQIVKNFLDEKEYVGDEKIDEKRLYYLAKKNKMSNFLINWAKQKNVSEEVKSKIQADFNEQIIKDTNENVEFERMLNRFEETGIQMLVVKGFLMKELYPQSYMRQMCDIDFMVHVEDLKKASEVMKELGFEKIYNHGKDLLFLKKPFLLVEMHRKLVVDGKVESEYFNKIWQKCIPYKHYQNILQLDVNDAYIFCITHLRRHIGSGGINVRDVLDVYLFYENCKAKFALDKIKAKLEEFEIVKFEENIRKIAYKWFGNEPNYDFNEVEKFIFQGANMKNQVNYAVGKQGGKMIYLRHLFFPTIAVMKEKYPVLGKAPILLPIAWIDRIAKDVFSKATTISARLNKIKLIKSTDVNDVEYIQKIYEELGIRRKEG